MLAGEATAMVKYLGTFLLTAAAAACAGTTSQSISYLDHPLEALSDTVEVNVWPAGMSPPESPFAILGEVYVERAGATVFSNVNREELLDELRQEARTMGADGIFSMLRGSSGVTRRAVDQAWFWGIAVVFVDRWIDREVTKQRLEELERQARIKLPVSE